MKAFRNLHNHSIGKCNICGKFTFFICSNILTARNNMVCIFCGSSSRKRHVASLVIEKLFEDISSISLIPRLNTNVKIYNVAVNDSFYKVLKQYNFFYSSEYLPYVEPGTKVKDKVYCQNVENLTFDDESFDLVISEDVFEHVRDYVTGFGEIYRVLRKNGYHIFTVPCFFDRKTLVRVDTSGDNDIYLLPPEYHGDPVRGKILAYRTFGNDIFGFLGRIGFETKVFFSKYVDQRKGIFDSYVFVSRK